MISLPATRYEIKFSMSSMNLADVRAWLRLHDASFSNQFPQRQVNNIYFDHFNLNRYHENLSGVSARHKVRLRWYGVKQKIDCGVFEVKRKQNMHGWKLSHTLDCLIDLDRMKWSRILTLVQKELKGELLIYFLQTKKPIIINTYMREYYVSMDGSIRTTLDYSQKVYDQRYSSLPNLKFPQPNSEDAVLEFKAGVDRQSQLTRVINDFPLRVSKFSKYINGISSIIS